MEKERKRSCGERREQASEKQVFFFFASLALLLLHSSLPSFLLFKQKLLPSSLPVRALFASSSRETGIRTERDLLSLPPLQQKRPEERDKKGENQRSKKGQRHSSVCPFAPPSSFFFAELFLSRARSFNAHQRIIMASSDQVEVGVGELTEVREWTKRKEDEQASERKSEQASVVIVAFSSPSREQFFSLSFFDFDAAVELVGVTFTRLHSLRDVDDVVLCVPERV